MTQEIERKLLVSGPFNIADRQTGSRVAAFLIVAATLLRLLVAPCPASASDR